MSNRKKPKPIPFGDIDCVRKTIEWHLQQASELHEQLRPHKTPRGLIGSANLKGNEICLIFGGCISDIFKVKDFLEKLDNEEL